MAPRKPTAAEPTSAALSQAQLRAAIPKVDRRLAELEALDINTLTNEEGGSVLDGFVRKINATLREVYGLSTVEYNEYSVTTLTPSFGFYYSGMDVSLRGNIDTVRSNVTATIATLRDIISILKEQLDEEGPDAASRTLRAYQGLELHPEIARAASTLYRDGHYANAVEASVKALNGLVRLRSGLEFDGSTLMERAFNPSNPTLKFNVLADQSDRDEQKGFMMLFSGAVAGLRNPRAHGFIEDDPERALEFIAFVSLLAKLLDGASA